jgi:hypothetical protein
MKANQAEMKANQAEMKANQAEMKANQAEMKANRSWQITAPLHWILTQTKRLRAEGPKSRVKAFIKKVLRKLNHELRLRPSMQRFVVKCCRRLGLYPMLKLLLIKAQGNSQSFSSSMQNLVNHTDQLDEKSPRLRREIFHKLKKAIQEKI